jgi:hypothetical protein
MFLRNLFADLISITIEQVFVKSCCRCCECGAVEKKGEVNIMFLLDATHDPVNFAVAIDDIRDKEGNVVPRSEVAVQLRFSDPTVLGAEYDQAADKGVLSFGAPGDSTFTLDVVDKDDPSQLLATKSEAFRLIAGDPNSVGSVNVSFEGISPVEDEGSGAEG